MKIFKYQIVNVPGTEILTELELPANSRLLSVMEQYGNVVAYALVDDGAVERTPVKYTLSIVGTGHPTQGWEGPENFVGTVSLLGGTLVLHVFAQRS